MYQSWNAEILPLREHALATVSHMFDTEIHAHERDTRILSLSCWCCARITVRNLWLTTSELVLFGQILLSHQPSF
jgi:hypothetical protein